MPPENTDPVPMAPHKRSRLWMILALLATLLSIGLGAALWYALAEKQPVTPSALTPAGSSQTAGGIEKLEAMFLLAGPSQKPGEAVDAFTFSFEAPRTWHTLDTTQIAERQADPLVDSANEHLLRLSMAAEASANASAGEAIRATNTIELRDVTDWLNGSDATSTNVQRQKAFNYIAQLAGESEPKQMTGDNKGMIELAGGLVGGPFLKAKGVTSADGTLKGGAYLTNSTQVAQYDPAAVVVMAGTVNEKKVVLHGRFVLYDDQYKVLVGSENIENVGKALSLFKAGGIASDTLDLYAHITDAVATVKITKNQ